MKFAHDLAFVYIDLGDPWWRTAVTEMLRSAERVLPHARLVQLSDESTPIHPWSHKILRGNIKCTVSDFPEFKSFLIHDHLTKSELPTIYSGADSIWCGYQAPDIPEGAVVTEVLGLKRVHFPGAHMRVPMIRFARAIDGGKQFDELAPITVERAEAMETLRQDSATLMELDLEKGPREPFAGEPGFGAINLEMPRAGA